MDKIIRLGCVPQDPQRNSADETGVAAKYVALAEFNEKDGPVVIAMPSDGGNFFLPGINPDKSKFAEPLDPSKVWRGGE